MFIENYTVSTSSISSSNQYQGKNIIVDIHADVANHVAMFSRDEGRLEMRFEIVFADRLTDEKYVNATYIAGYSFKLTDDRDGDRTTYKDRLQQTMNEVALYLKGKIAGNSFFAPAGTWVSLHINDTLDDAFAKITESQQALETR